MKKLISSLYLLTGLAPFTALAQFGTPNNSRSSQQVGPDTSLPNPLGSNRTLLDVIDGIANFILQASVLIGTLLVIYAGFLIMTAGGDTGKVEQAKKTILYTVIGLGVMLLFKVIIAIIGQIVGVKI